MQDKNYNFNISNTYTKIKQYNKQISENLFMFITKCLELETLSNHQYEIQKNIKLNKIYFQGYVLESNFCQNLKNSTSQNYSIKQLKNLISNYKNNSKENLISYYTALELYEQADNIENLIDTKIEYEIKKIGELTNTINNIENTNTNEYEMLYHKIKSEINTKYLNTKLITNNTFNICIQMLNDIFNYYIYGYINIPEEYLINS